MPTEPVQVLSGTLTDMEGNLHNQSLQKTHTAVVCGRTGPARAPYGPTRAVHDF